MPRRRPAAACCQGQGGADQGGLARVRLDQAVEERRARRDRLRRRLHLAE
jgi:hypothetical protein